MQRSKHPPVRCKAIESFESMPKKNGSKWFKCLKDLVGMSRPLFYRAVVSFWQSTFTHQSKCSHTVIVRDCSEQFDFIGWGYGYGRSMLLTVAVAKLNWLKLNWLCIVGDEGWKLRLIWGRGDTRSSRYPDFKGKVFLCFLYRSIL